MLQTNGDFWKRFGLVLMPTLAFAADATSDDAANSPAGAAVMAAVHGEVEETAGVTAGVHGISHSQTGFGVIAENTQPTGADLELAGTPPALITEFELSRMSESNLEFNFSNPGAGSMTLQVEGVDVVTTATDQDTLAALGCTSGQVAKKLGEGWVCASDEPETNLTLPGNLVVQGNTQLGTDTADTVTVNGVFQGSTPLVLEGAILDSNELSLTVNGPTADRTISIPDESGTLLTSNTATGGDLIGSLSAPAIAPAAVTGNKASQSLRTNIVVQRIGSILGGDERFLFVAPSSCDVTDVILLSDTGTVGSDGANFWQFQLNNLTQANQLLSIPIVTDGNEIPPDTPYLLKPDQNSVVALDDVLSLEIVQTGAPTDLSGAEIALQLRYTVSD